MELLPIGLVGSWQRQNLMKCLFIIPPEGLQGECLPSGLGKGQEKKDLQNEYLNFQQNKKGSEIIMKRILRAGCNTAKTKFSPIEKWSV